MATAIKNERKSQKMLYMTSRAIVDLLKQDLERLHAHPPPPWVESIPLEPSWYTYTGGSSPIPGYRRTSALDHYVQIDGQAILTRTLRFRGPTSDSPRLLFLHITETSLYYAWAHNPGDSPTPPSSVSLRSSTPSNGHSTALSDQPTNGRTEAQSDESATRSVADPLQSEPFREALRIEATAGLLPESPPLSTGIFPFPNAEALIGVPIDDLGISESCRCENLYSALEKRWMDDELRALKAFEWNRSVADPHRSASRGYRDIHHLWASVIQGQVATLGREALLLTWVQCSGFSGCRHKVLEWLPYQVARALGCHRRKRQPDAPVPLTTRAVFDALTDRRDLVPVAEPVAWGIVQEMLHGRTLVDVLVSAVRPIPLNSYLDIKDDVAVVCCPGVADPFPDDSFVFFDEDVQDAPAIHPIPGDFNEKWRALAICPSQSRYIRLPKPFQLPYPLPHGAPMNMVRYAMALWRRCFDMCDSTSYVLGTGSTEQNVIEMCRSMTVLNALRNKYSCAQGVYFFRVTQSTPCPIPLLGSTLAGDDEHSRDAGGLLYAVYRAWTLGKRDTGHRDSTRNPSFLLFKVGLACQKACRWLRKDALIDLSTKRLPLLAHPVAPIDDEEFVNHSPNDPVPALNPRFSGALDPVTHGVSLLQTLSARCGWSTAFTNAVVLQSGLYDSSVRASRGILRGIIVDDGALLELSVLRTGRELAVKTAREHRLPRIRNPWMSRVRVVDGTALEVTPSPEMEKPQPAGACVNYEYIVWNQDLLSRLVATADDIHVTVPCGRADFYGKDYAEEDLLKAPSILPPLPPLAVQSRRALVLGIPWGSRPENWSTDIVSRCEAQVGRTY